jgi:hypothetical protein
MNTYAITESELLMLELAKTDADEMLSGKVDWMKLHNYHCPNCGWIKRRGRKAAYSVGRCCRI